MNLGWKGIEEGKGHDFSDILAVLMYDCGREPSRAGLIVDFSRIGQFSRNFFDINTSDTTILNLERVPHVFNTSSRDLQSCARQQRPKVWLDQAARHHGATILGSSHMIVLAPFRGAAATRKPQARMWWQNRVRCHFSNGTATMSHCFGYASSLERIDPRRKL
jgi:hypothetical protein